MVPGSTLMYGSSLTSVTLMRRASRMAAREEEAMPLPKEDTTPPVMKMNCPINPPFGDRITPVSERALKLPESGAPLN